MSLHLKVNHNTQLKPQFTLRHSCGSSDSYSTETFWRGELKLTRERTEKGEDMRRKEKCVQVEKAMLLGDIPCWQQLSGNGSKNISHVYVWPACQSWDKEWQRETGTVRSLSLCLTQRVRQRIPFQHLAHFIRRPQPGLQLVCSRDKGLTHSVKSECCLLRYTLAAT